MHMLFPVSKKFSGRAIKLMGIESKKTKNRILQYWTRAIMHIIHFDFQRALDFNRLGFVVFPLLVMLWLKLIFGTFGIKLFKWF